jgi:hypothetical protein
MCNTVNTGYGLSISLSVNQPYLKSVLLERLDMLDMTLQSVNQPYLKSVLLERLDMLDIT